MITTNVFQRTFHIKRCGSEGTAFAIDRDSKQYLITAHHVIEGIKSGDKIEIFHERQWKNLTVNVVGVGSGTVDVAVLACPIQIAPQHPLEATSGGLLYGQPVFFLGFPFGLDSGGEKINRGLPLPFVKAGIVSAVIFENSTKIYIDAHGNQGFSGGPVVFMPNNQSLNQNAEYKVAGVVVHYPVRHIPIVNECGDTIVDNHGEPIGYTPENPGIVVAVGIRHATDLIDTNPIGFKLLADQNNL